MKKKGYTGFITLVVRIKIKIQLYKMVNGLKREVQALEQLYEAYARKTT